MTDDSSILVYHAVLGARMVGDVVIRRLGRSDFTLGALGEARIALIERFGRPAVERAELAIDIAAERKRKERK